MAAVAAAGVAHATAGAATADTVTLSQPFNGVKVTNRAVATGIAGVNDIFFVKGASSPTVGLAESYVVPAGTSRTVRVSNYSPTTGGTAPTNTVVSLISPAAVAYTVEGVTIA